jgi:hypothetical protein
MAVLAALEPVVLAGVAPFIKNPNTGQLIANEIPVTNALLKALALL